jgi:phage-related protein
MTYTLPNGTEVTAQEYQAYIISQSQYVYPLDKPTELPAVVGDANLTPPAVNGNDGRIAGAPSIPSCARGKIIGTSNHYTNKKRTHVCGFIDEMRKNVYLKEFIKASAKVIREGIRAVMETLGFTDKTGVFATIMATLKKIQSWLKVAQYYLKKVLDFEKYVLAYIVKIRAIIQWIISLPAKLLKLLSECLVKFLKLVKNVFSDFLKEIGGADPTGVSQIITETKKTVNEAVTTVKAATAVAVGAVTIAGYATAGFAAPVSQADLNAANRTITAYESTLPSAADVAKSIVPKKISKSTP